MIPEHKTIQVDGKDVMCYIANQPALALPGAPRGPMEHVTVMARPPGQDLITIAKVVFGTTIGQIGEDALERWYRRALRAAGRQSGGGPQPIHG